MSADPVHGLPVLFVAVGGSVHRDVLQLLFSMAKRRGDASTFHGTREVET